MPSTLPDGEPAPTDGSLPADSLAGLGNQPFGLYVHVPFCASRCGYCDFNTYLVDEVSGAQPPAYLTAAEAELDLAGNIVTRHTVQSVFFGGGTPTLLGADALTGLLRAIHDRFDLAPDAEVTTEANPESVDAAALEQLRMAGFTRVSFGMQSAVPHVLATLDRQHTPGRTAQAVKEAHAAGFDHVSVDLIYGTPGESAADWAASLQQAVDTGVDHVSAYALTVEPGTRLAARLARGEMAAPDDDEQADRYLAADDALTDAGLAWYEISNWARDEAAVCRHNMGYWTGADWWGIGPGAHSHVAGTRWWNVKHPGQYAEWLAEGHSPAAAREVLDAETRRFERVMLQTRLRLGCPVAELTPDGRAAAGQLAAEGLIDQARLSAGQVVVTLRGRLLADRIVRELVV